MTSPRIVCVDAGMSDISCDRVVIANDHLTDGTLSDVYMWVGPASRLANDYTSRWDSNGQENFTVIPEEDRGESGVC